MPMLEFTSALYLGLRHPSRSLRPWDRLSLGQPALLAEPPGAVATAAELAALQGCEAAVLLPSTLHLFFDLAALFADGDRAIYRDAGSYPIARWGAERAASLGSPLYRFAHHDADALRLLLARTARRGRAPVVLVDGFCPACGRVAPLADYLALVRRYGGLLVVDDTQALGVLGAAPDAAAPYGRGGGGTPRLVGLSAPDLLLGASLAKGFGVPVAALSGDAALLRRFRQRSACRVHCSPPSVAVIHAAARALAVNRSVGDALRHRLAGRTRRFRLGLGRLGVAADGGMFPAQVLRPLHGVDARRLHGELRQRGIRSLLLRGSRAPRLGFLITADHATGEIDACVAALAASLGPSVHQAHGPAPVARTQTCRA
jgi:8-amino-7-oxononanoate synthase